MKARKSLGQNFLRDEVVLKRISDAVEVSFNSVILEIGPGMGALTKYLVMKPCLVVAYEIDTRMKRYLDKFSNLEVYYEDFLGSDLNFLKAYENVYVVANLPYYITTAIIEHILRFIVPLKMVLLVQKEVALRFSAQSGSKGYGYFTVFLNQYYLVHRLFDVDASCFEPVPNVVSSVISLDRKEVLADINHDDFLAFVSKAFSHKRKTLKNNLGCLFKYVYPILRDFGFDENVRAEQISYDLFVQMFKSITEK